MAALIAGLRTGGVNVIDIGMVPTPVLYYATHHLGTQSGVMLTGSHNPADYNGLKMVLAGNTLTEEAIQRIKHRILDGCFHEGAQQGAYEENHALLAQYQAEVVAQCSLARPLKVVLDCGNGVTGPVAVPVLRGIGAEVVELYTEVDGRFPNHHPDPTRPELLQDLQAKVAEVQADVGLALDGDGDRLGVVTGDGEIIWADRQMMLLAQDVLSRHPGAQIIFDVKCTQHLAEVIEAHGGKPLMWQTGHSLVKAKMKQSGALLAGEMSGHIFFKENWYGFDDGLYVAARLCQLLAKATHTVSELFAALPNSINTPELKLAMADDKKFAFMQAFKEKAIFSDAERITIDGLRVHFKDGWGLIRPSNTTPCLVLRFEADSQAALVRIQQCFKTQLLALDPDLELLF
jgi:phosphomannomutase / phosphoglucomutase